MVGKPGDELVEEVIRPFIESIDKGLIIIGCKENVGGEVEKAEAENYFPRLGPGCKLFGWSWHERVIVG